MTDTFVPAYPGGRKPTPPNILEDLLGPRTDAAAIRAQLRYDYSLIPDAQRDQVQAAAVDIVQNGRKAQESLLVIGAKLTQVKEVLEHGQFSEWCSTEFDMSQRTAQNMMNVAKVFGEKNETVSFLSDSALYLLSAPSTPEPARVQVIEQAKATGKSPTKAQVQAVIEQHQPPKTYPYQRQTWYPIGWAAEDTAEYNRILPLCDEHGLPPIEMVTRELVASRFAREAGRDGDGAKKEAIWNLFRRLRDGEPVVNTAPATPVVTLDALPVVDTVTVETPASNLKAAKWPELLPLIRRHVWSTWGWKTEIIHKWVPERLNRMLKDPEDGAWAKLDMEFGGRGWCDEAQAKIAIAQVLSEIEAAAVFTPENVMGQPVDDDTSPLDCYDEDPAKAPEAAKRMNKLFNLKRALQEVIDEHLEDFGELTGRHTLALPVARGLQELIDVLNAEMRALDPKEKVS